MADAYYRRGRSPHYYKGGSYTSDLVTDLTPAEIAAYNAGYREQMESGDFKDWN